jgi:tetratricopeptide (TPR) repeat protein
MKTAYQFLAYNKGIEEYTNGQYEAAIKSLDLVMKYPLDDELVAKSRYWIADARFQLNQYNSAIPSYRFFLANSSGPNFRKMRADALYNLGYALYYGDFKMEAIADFKRFIENAPADDKRKIADANLRIADCYYLESAKQKDLSKEAIAYYQRVIDAQQGFEDRALYYQARCYGLTNQKEKQVNALNRLMNEYQTSSYRAKSIFEAGIVRRNQTQYAESNAFFERILNEFPTNILVKDALYELGVNHFRMNNFAKSEAYLERLLKDYGRDDKTCKYTTAVLVDLFQKSGNPSKITQLATRYPCSGITADYQDSLYFNTAYESYIDSNFVQAIDKFKDYKTAYPTGLQKDRANYLIAESYFSLGQMGNAYPYYVEVINSNASAYHEVSLIRAANYEYENQMYAEAIQHYTTLSSMAANPYRMFGAKLGLMRCHYLLENWSASLEAANFVVANNLATASEKLEARFCKGIALKKNANYTEAIPELEFVAANAKNQMGVQAKFNIAEIYHTQNDPKESEKQVRELLKMRPSYDYWTAKALLLQTKNLILVEDLFQAEHTLNSVMNNYTNQTDGILTEAAEIREALDALKNKPKDLPLQEGNTININD